MSKKYVKDKVEVNFSLIQPPSPTVKTTKDETFLTKQKHIIVDYSKPRNEFIPRFR